MPTILRGKVEHNPISGYSLSNEHDPDLVGTLLERYEGKTIDLVISVRVHD